MAAKENNVSAVFPAVSTSKKQQTFRQWTETKLKYFALALLDTIALKKTANKSYSKRFQLNQKKSCRKKISKKKIGANIVVEFCRQNEIQYLCLFYISVAQLLTYSSDSSSDYSSRLYTRRIIQKTHYASLVYI